MSKKKIALIFLATILCGYALWQLLLPNDPTVNIYKLRYEQMSKPEYLQELRNYCRYNLSDPIDNLNYTELVAWLHRHLEYTTYDFVRREMPIEILDAIDPWIGRAYGRCGEFALCYNGLCLANGYKTRLILDESKATGSKQAGDHVWVEVYDNQTWHPVEVTQSYEGTSGLIIDQPKYYRDVWNKEINTVIGITKDNAGKIVTVDVTKDYC